VLLGEAPSRSGDRFHNLPLSGPPARVLCRLAGIDPQPEGSPWGRWTWALYERFETMNLIKRYKDAEPWSAVRARDRAVRLAPALRGRVVVVLGVRVHGALNQALGSPFIPPGRFFEWNELHGAAWVLVPHPSGRNRTLNDAHVRERMGATLREAMARAAQ
jgi:hypothetical protein